MVFAGIFAAGCTFDSDGSAEVSGGSAEVNEPQQGSMQEEQLPDNPDDEVLGDQVQNDQMAVVFEHELPLEGNPVAGVYITTSGIALNMGEDGSYSWDETSVGGLLVTGTYKVYEGTIQQFDDGSSGYVTESETGPVYTVYIAFDQADDNILPETFQVYDRYDEDTFRVTDLSSGVQFEAKDMVAAIVDQMEDQLEQSQNN